MYLFKYYRESVYIDSLRKTSVSNDIPAMSSVLSENDRYRNVWDHTKAGHHQCAKAITLIMVDMIQMKKENQMIGQSLPRHMLSDTAVVTGLVLVLALSYSWCICALPKILVASPMDGNGVRYSNSADFCLNPHVLKTINHQKLISVSFHSSDKHTTNHSWSTVACIWPAASKTLIN